jgi:hypothetical protein
MDWLSITPTINQTGGANGITRGIYINPTLTSAPNWRAIEVTSGSVIFGSTGSGFYWDSTNLGLAIGGTTLDTGYALQVNSAKGIRISGSGAGSGYSLVRGTESSFFANNGSAGVLGSTNTLTFLTADVERMRIGSSGNVGIGTTTPAFTLDVSGSARIRGASNLSTTTAFTITNSDSVNVLQVQDNGYIRIGSQATSAFRVYSTDATGDVEPSGLNLVLNSRVITTATPSGIGMVTINGPIGTSTTGNQNVFLISKGFAPTSGTGTYAASTIIPTINQTGTGAFTLLNFAPTINTTGSGINYYISSSNYAVTSLGATISNILTLTPQSPLPSGVATGSFAVSSSVPPKPYFYDGTTWNALY